MVSHPGHIPIVDGVPSWVYLLFIVDGVPSWSQHQKCARGGGGFIYNVHSSISTLLSGAAIDPGHSTKIMRG